MRLSFLTLASFISLIPAATLATEIQLEFPMECELGKDCWIQQYPDHQPGEEYADYTCGKLAYNGHTGTDIRLKNKAEIEKGFVVKAAAEGQVRAIRNDMPDISIRETGKEAVANRECGNGLAIIHAGGYETQYCHLKKGSIKVLPGQKVAAGDALGEVGLSGLTEFPHLEFLVRKNQQKIDPFTGGALEQGCGKQEKSLWSAKARELMAYQPTVILQTGFTDKVPEYQQVQQGEVDTVDFSPASKAYIFWAEAMGGLSGDKIIIRMTDDKGNVLAQNEQILDRSKATMFSYIGFPNKGGVPMNGYFSGEYEILRKQGEAYVSVAKSTAQVRVTSQPERQVQP
jgi:hypothetical protein